MYVASDVILCKFFLVVLNIHFANCARLSRTRVIYCARLCGGSGLSRIAEVARGCRVEMTTVKRVLLTSGSLTIREQNLYTCTFTCLFRLQQTSFSPKVNEKYVFCFQQTKSHFRAFTTKVVFAFTAHNFTHFQPDCSRCGRAPVEVFFTIYIVCAPACARLSRDEWPIYM